MGLAGGIVGGIIGGIIGGPWGIAIGAGLGSYLTGSGQKKRKNPEKRTASHDSRHFFSVSGNWPKPTGS